MLRGLSFVHKGSCLPSVFGIVRYSPLLQLLENCKVVLFMMEAFLLTSLLLWFSAVGIVTALIPGNVAVRTRNGPGMNDADTLNAVGRALHLARAKSRRAVYSMNRTTLAKSWADAPLFLYGARQVYRGFVEVVLSGRYVTHNLVVQARVQTLHLWILMRALRSAAPLATSTGRLLAT